MNHYFLEKYETPQLLEEITPPQLLEGMKPLLDKFDDLLSIDVFLYSAMLKTSLISESGAYELVEIELEVIEELVNNNPTTHKRFKKKNKKALKLLVEHYNNLLDIPSDKSVYSDLYDALYSLDVDVGQIYIILSIIHVVIPLSMYEGINMSLALVKVFNDEDDKRQTEGLYV